jgi:uncharacterized membrane protein YidH (DUF202 family)
MRSGSTILIIAVFLLLAFVANHYLQKAIRPRESFSRLAIYFISVLLLIFSLSFLMILLIARLFPGEMIK